MSHIHGIHAFSVPFVAGFANRLFHTLFVSEEHSMSANLYQCPGGSCSTSVPENAIEAN
ncbi:hypothetical protein J2755_000319 [Methanohalophilus levihalophilus]|uniref:hypothetical protein n=1 Tax=Methanohalophilus levihalophilus TaxID=1431282 RepID=UPI001AEB3E4E|nr:hypothetical protein [Methanohalophilus levihalophilus]MBP2029399.1 hypothetical protein [Methanohalophilus levihalophilus]